LQDHARRASGAVKLHEGPNRARVAKLFPEERYGFLKTPDGREVYFHSNSVLQPGFDHLDVGAEVYFAEERGEKGTQASTVRFAKKGWRDECWPRFLYASMVLRWLKRSCL